MSIYDEIRSSGSNRKEHMEAFYQRQEDPFGFQHEMDQYSVVFLRIKEMIQDLLPNPYSMVDYGCSEGQLFQEWLKIFPNCSSYLGVDISPTAISRFEINAAKANIPNLDIFSYVGDMEDDQLAKSLSVGRDVILFHESLIHLNKPSKALREIFELSKPGSLIIISDGMKRPVVRFYLRDREPYKSQCRVVGYEPIKCRTFNGKFYNRFTTVYQKL